MQSYVTPSTIANEASLLRVVSRAPVVLVEGSDDGRLYRRFFLPQPHVHVIPCNGKQNVIDAFYIARDRGVYGVLPLCDADFDRIIGALDPNMYYADKHDVEMMIAYSAALPRVVEELVAAEHLANFSSDPLSVRDHLIEEAARIGRIRLYATTNGLSLDFKAVNPGDFLTADGVDLDDYIGHLVETDSTGSVRHDQLIEAAIDSAAHPVGELAQGHDFCALLDRMCANEEDGTRKGIATIEAVLRLSFDPACFRNTGLVVELEAWEQESNLDLLNDESVRS